MTGGTGSAELFKAVSRGSFIQVGGQQFRVCLSTVVEEVGPYDATAVPLCRVDAPFEAAFYHGSGYAHDLERVPGFLLDTDAGSGYDLGVGSSVLQTILGPFASLQMPSVTPQTPFATPPTPLDVYLDRPLSHGPRRY